MQITIWTRYDAMDQYLLRLCVYQLSATYLDYIRDSKVKWSHFAGIDKEAITIDGDDGAEVVVTADEEEKLLLLVSLLFLEGIPVRLIVIIIIIIVITITIIFIRNSFAISIRLQ